MKIVVLIFGLIVVVAAVVMPDWMNLMVFVQ
jgi:hypothetical protein